MKRKDDVKRNLKPMKIYHWIKEARIKKEWKQIIEAKTHRIVGPR
jgi:hypothetical protein